MKKTGIVICSYNMPEYTNGLVDHILGTTHRSYDLIVVDNGSDLTNLSQYTTHRLDKNIQMVPGFMYGLDQLDGEYYAYWLITTSVRFDTKDQRDYLDKLLDVLENDPLSYAAQPATLFMGIERERSAWKNLLEPLSSGVPRRVWATDYACTLYRADRFHQLGLWNKNLTRGWGVGSENFYLARKEGWHIYNHDGIVMFHDQGIGYQMERMKETAKERARKATEECDREFIPKYGNNYLEFLNWSYRN
jgi:GT2 family glycosyltransferase